MSQLAVMVFAVVIACSGSNLNQGLFYSHHTKRLREMTESEIKCGKIELALKARVIHLWSIPDRNNPAEEGSLHMLLLDEKGYLAANNLSTKQPIATFAMDSRNPVEFIIARNN